ncbi:MAG: deoxyribose-phosphate aldolase, partial [Candidatus Dormibacteraeota bacterium]|nr:deoxyribose-phosphate aldolase [Candidatus Dormibacteraeota bacterium]
MAAATTLVHLGSLMGGVRTVDQVGVEERAASLGKRSIKKASKVWALRLAIRMTDLTTLEGADTPGKVAALCAKARRPDPSDASVPSVAAICVYPSMVATAVESLRGSEVRVASVATAFPSGQSFLSVKLAETREAVAAGADEIDMVIDRGAFLSGDYQ